MRWSGVRTSILTFQGPLHLVSHRIIGDRVHALRIRNSHERFRVLVPVVNLDSDVFFQCRNAFVDTTAQELIGEVPEPTLYLVDPRRPGRREMDVKSGMALEPSSDSGSFVGGQVVADQMHIQLGRNGLVDRDQKLLEFHRSMTTMKCRNDGVVGDVEGREQTRHAGTDVIVTAPLRHARHQRQHRLRPIERLHTGFLVHTQHHGPFRWIMLQTNNIDDLVDELRIRGELEPVRQMRFQVELAPDPPDRRA